MTLEHAFNPAVIAVVGASEDTNKTGGRALDYLQRFGFTGQVFPVNPNADKIQGLPSYPSAIELPVAPDLAIIAVPGAAVLDAVRDCAEGGTKVVVVTSSGFGELSEEGKALEGEMLAVSRAHGMRIIGPNSQGVANFACGAVASFSSLFLEVTPADGPVAVISQSGSMSVVPYCQLRERGIGVRYCVASGNQIDLDVGDFALAAVDDPAIELVLLYFESLNQTTALAAAARKARVRGVPIVALKAGRSSRGQTAARSHTGALATEDRVVDAFLSRHGIWRATDPDELVRASELYLKGWRARGRSLAVLTDSGATAVMMADGASRLGLDLAVFSETTRSKLRAILPEYASVSNPIDMTSVLRTDPGLYARVLDVVVCAEVADLFFIGFPASGPGYDVTGLARMTAERFSERGLPLALAIPQVSIARHFQAAGIPTFSSETEGLKALHQLALHSQLMSREPPAHEPGPVISVPPGRTRFLSEAERLSFLTEQGLPVVPHALCETPDSALAALGCLGPSVVLKGSSPGVQHKSEHALVSVNITEPQQLLEVFETISARMNAMSVAADGIIVASMIRDRCELMIGARVDPVFGPVVLIGEGGPYVEVNKRFVTLAPPFSRAEVLDALRSLPGSVVGEGVRGESGADLDELAELGCRVGELISRTTGISSIDLNPVLVGKPGEGVVIVDGLIERAPDESPSVGLEN